jgi:DNA-binding NtrC family response regulator
VLVVEDEDVLRSLLERILVRSGCRVAGARDADEALRLFRAEPDRFDVVILDLGVPPHGALPALRALRALRPELGAVLTSGRGPDAPVREALRDARTAFVSKPFAPAELERALDRVRPEGA